MRNYRGLFMFLVALIAAAGAVVIASKWLLQRSSQVNQVAVAAQEINMGQKLTSNMFKLIDWPVNSDLPESFSNLKQLEGRVTKSTLQVGEPILAAKLAPEGSQGGLSAVIAEGKRAITVRVNDVVGVAGFALPGNFVDIIVNTQSEDEGNNKSTKEISKIVLEHILVLAVAQESGREETAPKVVNAVTLEVTPEQAEMIDLARSIGDLSLVLRNQSDIQNTKTQGVTKNSLLEISPVPIIKVSAAQPMVVVKKVFIKAKPVPQPVVRQTCTRVITGLTESKECF
ncbi:MAG TPA: Flp pilus assembly protein CpaB [Methylotenera sp.]|nr:Flp pilus assembly protein CpaB [Methylotenera sp.]